MSAEATKTDEQKEINLGNLTPAKGSNRRKMRVGRGRATGCGKTSNRGHNGEGQRAGRSKKRGFEGGQMPEYRRLPKFRTFSNPNQKTWLELNVGQLEQVIPAEQDNVSYQDLVSLGLLKHKHDGLRILGNGEIARKFTIQAHHVTTSAKAKLEKAGVTVELLDGPLHKYTDLSAC